MKKIKILNGRWQNCLGHAYVGCYSYKQAIELLKQAGYQFITMSEINVYWSKGCWGNAMNGIEPQIGVWFQSERDSPVKRLI
jgi:hypothetical protein